MVSDVETEYIDVGRMPFRTWKGISFLCPKCRTVLGVAIDPVSLMHEGAELAAKGSRGQ